MKKTLQEIYDGIQKAYPNRWSDKGIGAYGPVQNGPGHTFAQFYDILFAKWRDEPIDLLEIGINRGGSLKMWREFFPNAHITGFDIYQSFEPFSDDECISTYILNAFDNSAVNKAIGDKKFDIIIDDGPHEAESQVHMFKNYSCKVKNGGLYVIEDIQYIDKQFHMFSCLDPKPTIIDRRWRNGQPDDVLLLFQF